MHILHSYIYPYKQAQPMYHIHQHHLLTYFTEKSTHETTPPALKAGDTPPLHLSLHTEEQRCVSAWLQLPSHNVKMRYGCQTELQCGQNYKPSILYSIKRELQMLQLECTPTQLGSSTTTPTTTDNVRCDWEPRPGSTPMQKTWLQVLSIKGTTLT